MGFGTGNLGMGVTFTLSGNAVQSANAISGAMNGLEKTVNNVSASISRSAGAITSGIVSVAATATLLVGPFVKGIQMANKFEQSLSAAFARGGADNLQQLDLLRQEAFKISEETKFGAQDVADTYIVLAQAGFKNLQILNQIRPTTMLAAAGDVSLAQAAEYAANAMHQFNLQSEDFGMIADVLVSGANESAQSVENLNNGLKYLGPTAKSLNMSLQETVAYTQMVSNAGMKGSIGTRAFGSALMGLAGGTEKVTRGMQAIGVDPFAGPNRTFVGLGKFVHQLSAAYKNMSQEARLKSIAQIFGKDASQEISTLLLENIQIVKDGKKMYMSAGDALEYFTQKNFNAAGLAQRTNDIMMDNAQGWIDRIKALFKTTMIDIGEVFQESIKSIGPYIIRILQSINRFIKTPFGAWLLKTAMIIGLVTTALVALSFVFVTLIPAIWSMVSAAAALVATLAPVLAIVAAVTYGIYKASEGMNSFADATLNAAGAFDKPLTAWEKIGGVMAGLGEIWKTWDGNQFTLSADLHDKLSAAGVLDETLNIGTYLVRAQEFAKGFMDSFKFSQWNQVGDAMVQVGEALKNILLQLGLGPASGSLNWWKDLGRQLGDVFNGTLVSTLKAIANVFEALFNGLSLVIATIVELKNNGIFNFDTKEWFSFDRVFANAFNGGDMAKTGNHGKITTPAVAHANDFVSNNFENPKSIGELMALTKGEKSKSATTPADPFSKPINIQLDADVMLDTERVGKIIMRQNQTAFERGAGN